MRWKKDVEDIQDGELFLWEIILCRKKRHGILIIVLKRALRMRYLNGILS